jgi:hypothetical protein
MGDDAMAAFYSSSEHLTFSIIGALALVGERRGKRQSAVNLY